MKLFIIILAVIVLVVALILRIREDRVNKATKAKQEGCKRVLPTHLEWVDTLINNTLKIEQ